MIQTTHHEDLKAFKVIPSESLFAQVHVSADATELSSQGATYTARIALDQQHLISPQGTKLQAGAGMQVAAEIHQGRRTVLEYLLSPVSKAVQEAGREK